MLKGSSAKKNFCQMAPIPQKNISKNEIPTSYCNNFKTYYNKVIISLTPEMQVQSNLCCFVFGYIHTIYDFSSNCLCSSRQQIRHKCRV